MPTIADMLKTEIGAIEARKQAARELEKVNDPKRHSARLRAEAHRQKNCPINILAKAVFPAVHRELDTITQHLVKVRAPIKAMAEDAKANAATDVTRKESDVEV